MSSLFAGFEDILEYLPLIFIAVIFILRALGGIAKNKKREEAAKKPPLPPARQPQRREPIQRQPAPKPQMVPKSHHEEAEEQLPPWLQFEHDDSHLEQKKVIEELAPDGSPIDFDDLFESITGYRLKKPAPKPKPPSVIRKEQATRPVQSQQSAPRAPATQAKQVVKSKTKVTVQREEDSSAVTRSATKKTVSYEKTDTRTQADKHDQASSLLFADFSLLKRAVLWSEVLGPPKALREESYGMYEKPKK